MTKEMLDLKKDAVLKALQNYCIFTYKEDNITYCDFTEDNESLCENPKKCPVIKDIIKALTSPETTTTPEIDFNEKPAKKSTKDKFLAVCKK